MSGRETAVLGFLATWLLLVSVAHAAPPSPAQIGLDKAVNPGNLSVLDTSGAWVELGALNSSTHTLAIPNASLASASITVGGVACALGGSCAPSTTVNSTVCTLGSSCSISLAITVGSTTTSGGAAGQIMFDSGSVLQENAALVFANPVLKIVSNTAELAMGTAGDTSLFRDGAGILSQRNSTSPQLFGVYNTFTNASNYERGVFDWNHISNVLTIGTEAAGTGQVRNFEIALGSFDAADYGVTSTNMWHFGSNTVVNGAVTANSFQASTTVIGSNITTGILTTSGSILANAGNITAAAGSLISGAVASTVSTGVSYGGTVEASSHCGTLSGASGCIIMNINGVQHDVPYY